MTMLSEEEIENSKSWVGIQHEIDRLSKWLFSCLQHVEDYGVLQNVYDKHPDLEDWFDAYKANIRKVKEDMRKSALAKLTPEEIELLGIK